MRNINYEATQSNQQLYLPRAFPRQTDCHAVLFVNARRSTIEMNEVEDDDEVRVIATRTQQYRLRKLTLRFGFQQVSRNKLRACLVAAPLCIGRQSSYIMQATAIFGSCHLSPSKTSRDGTGGSDPCIYKASIAIYPRTIERDPINNTRRVRTAAA